MNNSHLFSCLGFVTAANAAGFREIFQAPPSSKQYENCYLRLLHKGQTSGLSYTQKNKFGFLLFQ